MLIIIYVFCNISEKHCQLGSEWYVSLLLTDMTSSAAYGWKLTAINASQMSLTSDDFESNVSETVQPKLTKFHIFIES